MARKNQPSSKQLRQILNESVFNPREPGPMSLILEQSNASYYESRAVEMIREAQQCLGPAPTPNDQQLGQYHHKLAQAISLLGMARLTRKTAAEGAPR